MLTLVLKVCAKYHPNRNAIWMSCNYFLSSRNRCSAIGIFLKCANVRNQVVIRVMGSTFQRFHGLSQEYYSVDWLQNTHYLATLHSCRIHTSFVACVIHTVAFYCVVEKLYCSKGLPQPYTSALLSKLFTCDTVFSHQCLKWYFLVHEMVVICLRGG